MKSWIKYSNENSIVWWASHGELLGWAWNGNLMPWDLDWDLQMTTYQLVQLAAHNGTLIDERFLIDVNPSIYVRTRQPNNVIDARIIDTWTGYFVDLTGVSFLDRELMNQDFRNQTFAWTQEEESRLSEESDPVRGYCKSIHRYSYDELMPLHETVLEGLKVWRPRKTMQLLVREYTIDALLKEKYENGHRGEIYSWNNGTAVWDLVEVKGEFDPVQTETTAATSVEQQATETATATLEAVQVEAPTSTSEDNAIETWEFVGEQ
ncbi:LicD family-domain-containing protein [Chytriomyces cf. hyalinus JEL632]|nr:LicD family-domain-containing protein [Chytriomyces cf. hyalinus JEL632]